MNKKGMEMSFTVGLILLLAALIVIGFSLAMIVDWMTKTGDKESCRQSIEVRANTKIKLGGAGAPLVNAPINCKSAPPIEIKNTKDWEDKSKEELANLMHDCWYMFGEGKLDFMNTAYDFSSGEVRCWVCGSLHFDESLKGEKINNFGRYLIESGEANYIYGQDFNPNELNAISQGWGLKSEKDKPLKSLYVLFVAEKNTIFNFNEAVTTSDMLKGCGYGAAAGAAAGFFLLPGLGVIPGATIGCIIGEAKSLIGTDFGYKRYLYVTDDGDMPKCG